jgi:hypothetical protein
MLHGIDNKPKPKRRSSSSKQMLCPICRAPILSLSDLMVSIKYKKLVENTPATCMQATITPDGNVTGVQGLTVDMKTREPEVPFDAAAKGKDDRRRKQAVPDVQFIKSEFKNAIPVRNRRRKGGPLLKGLMSGMAHLYDSVKEATTGRNHATGSGGGEDSSSSISDQELQYYTNYETQQEMTAFRQWANFQVGEKIMADLRQKYERAMTSLLRNDRERCSALMVRP